MTPAGDPSIGRESRTRATAAAARRAPGAPASRGAGSSGGVLDAGAREHLAIGGRSERLDLQVAGDQRLGVPQEEEPGIAQQVDETAGELSPGLTVEVDQDIPAEDGVEGAAHGPGADQIEVLERHEAA